MSKIISICFICLFFSLLVFSSAIARDSRDMTIDINTVELVVTAYNRFSNSDSTKKLSCFEVHIEECEDEECDGEVVVSFFFKNRITVDGYIIKMNSADIVNCGHAKSYYFSKVDGQLLREVFQR